MDYITKIFRYVVQSSATRPFDSLLSFALNLKLYSKTQMLNQKPLNQRITWGIWCNPTGCFTACDFKTAHEQCVIDCAIIFRP